MSSIVQNKEWHSVSYSNVLESLDTSSEGLSTTEAGKRLKKEGPNIIYRQSRESAFKILLRQFLNPLIYVLLTATILAITMGKITDGIVVFCVIIINAIIGFVQEYQAGKTIQGLLQLIPENATVIRDGKQKNIQAAELVPGDYVLLQAGDKVSADMRLTFVKNMQCNESILTGESLPVEKNTDIIDADAGVADRKNMVFSGTLITSGTAEGVVVLTGIKTEIGKISALLQITTSVKSPLTKSLEKIARGITYAIILVGILVFLIGIFRNYTFIDAIFFAITLAVAAIPEGLPAVITIASAIGIMRMAKRQAIIKHLSAVETLGSTTVICSDKTGTLTLNEMTVQVLWNGKQKFNVTGVGINTDGKILKNDSDEEGTDDEIGELIKAAALCNDATLHKKEGHWKSVGDPTEVALIAVAGKFGINEDELRSKWRRLDELPFDSEKKIMATLHLSPSGEKMIYLKGAPESVIPLLLNSENSSIVFDTEQVRTEALQLAGTGMRVLAFASRKLDSEHSSLITEEDLCDFTFLGIQAISDPPRMEVKEAIDSCHNAGITVKMITGDHPATAAAIGRELGFINADRVITGKELQNLNAQEIQEVVKNTNIFARVSPEDKLNLVKALQANGEVVAMTGDGVNDAPALKRADIGVAMGISGTAVAKEAADIILADDNFESIKAAVEEGRRVFDNLLKSIVFLLPTSIGLGLVIFIAVLFFPSEGGILLIPIQPVQVLWINLITAVALSLPLALEAMEPNVMNRPPRKPNKPLLSSLIIFRMTLVSLVMAGGTIGLFLWEYNIELSRGMEHSLAISEAQTMAVTAMVLFQVFYLIDCRSLNFSVNQIGLFSNPFIYIGIATVLFVQAAFVYFPFMNRWFHSSPLKAEAWGMSAMVAFSILIIISVEKWIQRKYFKNVKM
ncbi:MULTISPECIES: HAD-IC family P-type ATPase [Flavobacterium]|uniref:HAD family hydrolase n=3 Tax=Flavobacterium TaxID=237 RepID=A0A4V2Z1A5_9FLAO|nr:MULTISPECIES: HAD-IC family P-type ATPase [Flavobacterium]PIF62624.1 Ca2+-transporting ATPase [Flavobacterium sp. 11]RBN49020.1 HAD family hydrolase [Flavobacterium psychrolimnae]TDD77225.1 HAD family hydrolase [Flavobacterium caseinilyticum]TDE04238.1 HAD family hydrolase [Flavobacterium sandaracinum]WKL43851.1 HAD-IC family P-type ATPase [Flavobacterium sp. ZE23DGlu08]